MSKRLLESDSDSASDEDSGPLNINQGYAERYEQWRRKEELQKLKNKYGDHLDLVGESDEEEDRSEDGEEGSSSDDDESEESVDEEVFDEQFFKVYSALRNKNPEIYDKEVRFFDKPVTVAKQDKKTDQPEKMSLINYHQKLISERDGVTEEDMPSTSKKGYYEELNEIKNEFKSLQDSDDDELLKTKNTKDKRDDSHRFDLLKDKHQDKDINILKSLWKNEKKLDEGEKYLRNFILQKRYKTNLQDILKDEPEGDDELNEEPEIENEFDKSEDEEKEENDGEVNLAKFHFEEKDATKIKRFPRNLKSFRDQSALQVKAAKRTERKERKKREKESELKRLRKLKRDELKEKLIKLKSITNNEKIDIKDFDLDVLIDDENDFDPEKYDEKMKYLFDQDYYGGDDDEEKPEFDFVEGIDDAEESVEQTQDHEEDSELQLGKKESKKKKKKKDPTKNVGIYEDLIGGEIPTRFRYRKVQANDYGLTDEEIILADDKELNKWCSLMKTSQYLNEDEEKKDLRVFKSRRNNEELKRKILKSLYEEPNPPKEVSSKSKNKKKRRRKKPKLDKNETESCEKKEKKIKKKKSNDKSIDEDRLKAYGLSSKQVKKLKSS